MSNKISVGVIGTGNMAASHAAAYRKIEGVDVAACFDVDAERAAAFAAKQEIATVSQSVENLFGAVDAVSIVTPDRFHGTLTIAALAAGKHILCEKPLTLTLSEAEQVADAAREASARGVIHMVNFSYRASAAFQAAIALAKQGALGEIRHVHSHYLQSWLVNGFESATIGGGALWRLSTPLGSQGVLGDLGCHILDLTTACTEDLRAIRCDLRNYRKRIDGVPASSVNGHPLDANDTAIVEFELAGGGVGVCHTTRWATGRGNSIRLEAHGTEGALRFDLDADPDTIEIWGADGEKSWTAKKLAKTPTNYERFIGSIRSGVQDQPDIVRGARVQAYLDACERSAASRQWETV
jgi:predicted dehydrogenase